MAEQVDVIVIGAGMVGAASALGFAQKGLRVVMIDAQRPQPFGHGSEPDLRVSALSVASVNLLKQLGAWQYIEAMRVCAYERLRTWEVGSTELVFEAAQLGLSELGFMVENRLVQLGLWQACEQANVRIIEHANAQLLHCDETGACVQLDELSLCAKLLVVADGANSPMRQALGLGIRGWDYRQACLSINVKLDAPQQMETWQQFTPSGPMAMLPLSDGHAALIWYDDKARNEARANLAHGKLRDEIYAHFPSLAGDIHIQNVGCFPLTRRHALRYQRACAVVIGDAAHTINPLAGQGVNLGFRDVAALLKHLGRLDNGEHIAQLRHVCRLRQADNALMQTSMDAFYLGFSTSHTLVSGLRKAGLHLAQHSGPLKNAALRYALGI